MEALIGFAVGYWVGLGRSASGFHELLADVQAIRTSSAARDLVAESVSAGTSLVRSLVAAARA